MGKDYRESHKEERVARQYEERVYGEGSYDDMLWRWEQGMLRREMDDLKANTRTVSLLDFATGTGRILSFLENEVADAVGVDNAEAMLSFARTRVRKAALVRADITQEDALAGREFDLITAFRFFLNAQPELRDAALAALLPKLRDEHSLFIFNIHGNLISYRFFTKLWYALRGRRLNAMTVWQAKELAERHGLKVVRWYGFGVKPKFLYRWFGPRFMFWVDSMLSFIPGVRYVSYDLVFVCKRQNNFQGHKIQ